MIRHYVAKSGNWINFNDNMPALPNVIWLIINLSTGALWGEEYGWVAVNKPTGKRYCVYESSCEAKEAFFKLYMDSLESEVVDVYPERYILTSTES